MPDPSIPPPLRVLQTGAGNFIPVFELELSGGTLTKVSPTRVRYVPPGISSGAPNDARYVTLALDATLSAEEVLTPGQGLSLTTGGAGGNVVLAVDTIQFVASTRTLTAGVGLTGGGDLSADRTFNVFTGGAGQYAITSHNTTEGIVWINTAAAGGGPVYAPTGGNYVAFAADANLTSEKVLTVGSGLASTTDATTFLIVVNSNAVVSSSRTLTAGVGLTGGGDLSADRTFHVFTGGAGQYVITSHGSAEGIAWINTAAAGASATKTVLLPLALLTVQPDTGNAFWTASAGALTDFGHVAYVDAGDGISTWWGVMPANLASAPSYNLVYYLSAETLGDSGVGIISARGRSLAHGESFESAYTVLANSASYTFFRQGTLTVAAVSAGAFDSVLATSATDYFMVEVHRHGGTSGDTLQSVMNLHAVALRVDVA